jgi:hypothetical protein
MRSVGADAHDKAPYEKLQRSQRGGYPGTVTLAGAWVEISGVANLTGGARGRLVEQTWKPGGKLPNRSGIVVASRSDKYAKSGSPIGAPEPSDALRAFRAAQASFRAHVVECARCLDGRAGLSYRQQSRGDGCPLAWPLFKELQRTQLKAFPS